MKTFERYNPIAVGIYFLAVAILPMLCMSPVILLPSLVGAVSLFMIAVKRNRLKTNLIMLVAVLIMIVINPIYSHKGDTVIFFINDTPFTLEAVLYGVAAALTVAVTVYWFRSFSEIMTEDKLMYIFGRISPKLALTLSMALRYVSLFTARIRKTVQAQKANGLYKTDSITDSMKSGARVFSVNVTWALENGVVTASSMRARGYGCGRRTSFTVFRFRGRDAAMLAVTLILLSLSVVGVAMGGADVEFYPRFTVSFGLDAATLLTFIPYTALCFVPIFIEMEERLKWSFLLSRI